MSSSQRLPGSEARTSVRRIPVAVCRRGCRHRHGSHRFRASAMSTMVCPDCRLRGGMARDLVLATPSSRRHAASECSSVSRSRRAISARRATCSPAVIMRCPVPHWYRTSVAGTWARKSASAIARKSPRSSFRPSLNAATSLFSTSVTFAWIDMVIPSQNIDEAGEFRRCPATSRIQAGCNVPPFSLELRLELRSKMLTPISGHSDHLASSKPDDF